MTDLANRIGGEIWRARVDAYATKMSNGRWLPYPYLRQTAKLICDAIHKGHGRIILNWPPRHGKALSVKTPVPTPEGWREIGKLRPGDYVFDDQGEPTQVVAVSEVWKDRQLYKVSGKEVEPIWADEDHEWRVRLCRKHKVWSIKDTKYLAERTGERRPLVDHHPGLGIPFSVLPVDPWVLGMWLGDGRSRDGGICVGDQDRPFVLKKLTEKGFEHRMHADGTTIGVLALKKHLVGLEVIQNKHIPSSYLRASGLQRRLLLQGLIDSDGHVAPDGQVEFCSTNRRLANDTAELVRSLGVKCNILEGRATLDGRDVGPKYRVMFYMDSAASLPRKAERCRNGIKQPGLYLDFEPDGRGDTVCIQVASPRHMFLAGKSMVPTHNSELFSFWLPTWFLDLYPEKHVISCSYDFGLVADFGRKIRDVFDNHELSRTKIRRDKTAAHDFVTAEGGGYKAASIGGPIIGKGGHLMIVDDPHKNWEEANSPTIRKKITKWFDSTFYSRKEPGATVVVIQQRWNQEDLTGWLMDEHGDEWLQITMPALAEQDDFLGRAPGEALCPARYDENALLGIKNAMHPQTWAGLYQQRPAPEEGGIIKRVWIKHWDPQEMPENLSDYVMSWDMSFKETGQSWVVGQVWARDRSNYYLLDQVRKRMDFADTLDEFRSMCRRWPQCTTKLVEEAANGHAVISSLRDEIPGIVAVKAKGSKESRLYAVSPYFQSGNVWLPPKEKAVWVESLIEELIGFPNMKNDDQCDGVSQALNRYRTSYISGFDLPSDVGLETNPYVISGG